MFDAQKVKELIEKGLPCEYVEVVGDDGVHFSSIVVGGGFVERVAGGRSCGTFSGAHSAQWLR